MSAVASSRTNVCRRRYGRVMLMIVICSSATLQLGTATVSREFDSLLRLLSDSKSSRRNNEKHQHSTLFRGHSKNGNSDPCSAGVDMTGNSGTLRSPGFSQGRYPGNVRCGWRLNAAPGKLVQVTFSSLNIEASADCQRDSVTLVDGLSPNGPVLGSFCGKSDAFSVVSTEQSMIVTFVSDGQRNTGGFSINWNSVNPVVSTTTQKALPAVGNNPCSSIVELRQQTGSIQIPIDDKESEYANNALCQWRIVTDSRQRIRLTISRFGLELSADCTYDSLSIYDGPNDQSPLLGKYCGMRLPQELIQSTKSALLIKFTTDEENTNAGFTLSWTSVGTLSQTSLANYGCGKPFYSPSVSFGSRIVNGEEARANSWPWMCSIQYKSSSWIQWCGASVINNTRVVLTAAHCAFDDNNKRISESNFRVVCGDHNQAVVTDPNRQVVLVSGIILHPQFNPKYKDFDIAVFQLREQLVFNNVVSPICLAQENVANQQQCVVAGWGNTKGTGDSKILRQAVVPVLSQTVCSQATYYPTELTDNMLCAGYATGGTDSCDGDSGGPLMCPINDQWVLYGIVSFGVDCARFNKPGVYVRITRYLAWITSNTGVSF